MSGTEGAKMTKGKEVSRERAQEGGSLGLATIAVIGTWGQGAQWRSSSQTSTPGWGGGGGGGDGERELSPCGPVLTQAGDSKIILPSQRMD